jgi:hypothetical protein
MFPTIRSSEVSLTASSIVTFVLLAVSLLPMILLVNSTPDQIPADVVAQEQNAALAKAEGV